MCIPREKCPPAFSVVALMDQQKKKCHPLLSHVSTQRCVKLCETLDQLLKLGPLLGVQGPATSHHCKPATQRRIGSKFTEESCLKTPHRSFENWASQLRLALPKPKQADILGKCNASIRRPFQLLKKWKIFESTAMEKKRRNSCPGTQMNTCCDIMGVLLKLRKCK